MRDHWRAARPWVSLDDEGAEPAAGQSEPVAVLAEAELGKAVEAAIDRLPFAQREVLTLRVHAGLTFAEISEVMAAPLGTSLARMRYALANLRRILEEGA
jgi:DNA-directed RNA polymerase specialized sigma24 family protein